MAKKKTRKNTKKDNTFKYSNEIIGLIVVLIAIIGFCGYGIVGDLIRGFGVFLAGAWYQIILIGMFVCGIYMMVKRELPNFWTSRLIGLYLIFLSILLFSHLSYVTSLSDGIDIFKETLDNFMISLKSIDSVDGGGMIGALFSFIFVKLLTVRGAQVVSASLIVFGIILLFNVSIVESFKWIGEKFKETFSKKDNKNEDIEEVQEETPKKEVKIEIPDLVTQANEMIKEETKNDDDKIVISSVNDIEQVPDKNIKKDPVIHNNDEPYVYNDNYKLPPVSLLDEPKKNRKVNNDGEIKGIIKTLENVFKDFQIAGHVTEVHVGPTVTQYEVELKSGTRVSKILSINKEIALALSAKDVRIQAPIPGKHTIGIEIPNPKTTMVSMREIIATVPESMRKNKLVAALGKNIMGKPVYAEIDKTPHLLVAGSTGSGKSVCINGIIISILMRAKPDEVKLLMVDPKKVELSMYNGVPHLLAPVVSDPKKASLALQKIVSEMEDRYDLFSGSKTKNIKGYNEYVEKRNLELAEDEKLKKLPYIVVIIDELADLMMVASKEVEDSIMRITQMARAAGIHLIIATQRPSTDVITGVIKANIPSRISFAVSSSIDSRTILDMTGAEKLIGKGDMLFLPMGESAPERVQGNFISEEEILRIVEFVIDQQKAKYDENLMNLEKKNVSSNLEKEEYDDPLYDEIVDYVIATQRVSASSLQRKYRLGYNRAARIVDLLEERGIIGPANGSKPREVLVKNEDNNNNDEI